jgi:hypothetical protein
MNIAPTKDLIGRGKLNILCNTFYEGQYDTYFDGLFYSLKTHYRTGSETSTKLEPKQRYDRVTVPYRDDIIRENIGFIDVWANPLAWSVL